MEKLVTLISQAKRLILTTHRQCDGDGLGAELALFFALQKLGKEVRVINVDATPKKYRFLKPDSHIQYFDRQPLIPFPADLTIVFDTNDSRMLGNLYPVLQKSSTIVAFLDHHPVLKNGPLPTPQSFIDTTAASTGELAYRLIKALKVEPDRNIARCLYTSIVFDTQLFRFIRNSPVSHEIAAEMLKLQINPEEIHRCLFGHQTVNKMAFLAKALAQIEYYSEGQLAFLRIKDSDMFHYNLDPDESRDVIDMLMNIETLEAAALFREDSPHLFKISMRSKGLIEVLSVAEKLGGGGHPFAAGAQIKGNFLQIKDTVVADLSAKLANLRKTGS